jgi:hypothetical protein
MFVLQMDSDLTKALIKDWLVGIPINSSPLAFVPSPDHVGDPLVDGPTNVDVRSFLLIMPLMLHLLLFWMHLLYHLIFQC